MMQSSQTLTLNLVGLEKSEVAVGNAVVEHVKFFSTHSDVQVDRKRKVRLQFIKYRAKIMPAITSC